MEMTFIKFMTDNLRDATLDKSMTDWAAQLKSLTPADREWFTRRAQVEMGVTITPAKA